MTRQKTNWLNWFILQLFVTPNNVKKIRNDFYYPTKWLKETSSKKLSLPIRDFFQTDETFFYETCSKFKCQGSVSFIHSIIFFCFFPDSSQQICEPFFTTKIFFVIFDAKEIPPKKYNPAKNKQQKNKNKQTDQVLLMKLKFWR